MIMHDDLLSMIMHDDLTSMIKNVHLNHTPDIMGSHLCVHPLFHIRQLLFRHCNGMVTVPLTLGLVVEDNLLNFHAA